MGCYINPENMTKEEWLEKNAQELKTSNMAGSFSWEDKSKRLIILVDNGPFTAAAVLYSQREAQHFLIPMMEGRDLRPIKVYIANTEDLKAVSPIEDYMKHSDERGDYK